MKITFPHLGDAHRYGGLLMREIGVEVVRPDYNCAESLERGSSISPEEACLPFKLMAGNLLSAWEKGADTAVMPATMGPCRLGEYGELLREVLEKEGCVYRWILLDAREAIGAKELLNRLGQVVSEKTCGPVRLLKALSDTYKLVTEFEALEAEARIRCGLELEKGTSGKILEGGRRELERAGSLKEARQAIRQCRRTLAEVAVDEKREPLRILLTGEIYSSIEPFANHRMEALLMSMGISFERRITIGWWLRDTIAGPIRRIRKINEKNPYMPCCIGGYAHETLKEISRYDRGEFDGIIQLLPVGCMPEIVAKSVFDDLCRKGELRVLSVIFDEMGGEAGYITRVEAFLDLLEQKQNHRLRWEGRFKRYEVSGN